MAAAYLRAPYAPSGLLEPMWLLVEFVRNF
jgi:hypothetical protein